MPLDIPYIQKLIIDFKNSSGALMPETKRGKAGKERDNTQNKFIFELERCLTSSSSSKKASMSSQEIEEKHFDVLILIQNHNLLNPTHQFDIFFQNLIRCFNPYEKEALKVKPADGKSSLETMRRQLQLAYSKRLNKYANQLEGYSRAISTLSETEKKPLKTKIENLQQELQELIKKLAQHPALFSEDICIDFFQKLGELAPQIPEIRSHRPTKVYRFESLPDTVLGHIAGILPLSDFYNFAETDFKQNQRLFHSGTIPLLARLFRTIKDGTVEELNDMLDANPALIDRLLSPEKMTAEMKEGVSPLSFAAQTGDLRKVKLLCEKLPSEKRLDAATELEKMLLIGDKSFYSAIIKEYAELQKLWNNSRSYLSSSTFDSKEKFKNKINALNKALASAPRYLQECFCDKDYNLLHSTAHPQPLSTTDLKYFKRDCHNRHNCLIKRRREGAVVYIGGKLTRIKANYDQLLINLENSDFLSRSKSPFQDDYSFVSSLSTQLRFAMRDYIKLLRSPPTEEKRSDIVPPTS